MKAEFLRLHDQLEIPENYAVASHNNNDRNSRPFSRNGNIVPRLVQEDLFDRIKADLKYVSRKLGRGRLN